MINIDFGILNPLEKKIHAALSEQSKKVETIRITDAAALCDCSVSKISKFTKKLGFSNYKQYLDFLYGRTQLRADHSSELDRLENFIHSFDSQKVRDVAKLIAEKDKLVLLGYGPSYVCAQYFEYRLKTCSNKATIAMPDEWSARTMIDANSLLLILTVTGSFKSFADIYKDSEEKGGSVALIVEEYNPDLIRQYDKIFCLTRDVQSRGLKPYEKNRTLFFIFMEEVIRELTRMT